MKNTEIVDIYLKSLGMKRVSGDSLEPILPHIMMDAQYQIYCKEIKPLDCKHRLKKFRNEWIQHYNLFNRQFFSAFTDEQKDEVIDKMDSFERYIYNDIVIAKVSIMNCCTGCDFQTQKVLAACALCNILAQAALVIWQKVYKNSKGQDTKNLEIEAIGRCASLFMHEYYRGAKDISCNNDNVDKAISVLCRKMVKWLYDDKMSE